MKHDIILSWSGGKDCAFALSEMKHNQDYQIKRLLTTIDRDTGQVNMHGIPRSLLEKQASSLGIQLDLVELPSNPSNKEYESIMQKQLGFYQSQAIHHIAFADLFLEDIRHYRMQQMQKAGMQAVFPIWKRNTRELARTFVERGFKAIITCTDSTQMESKYTGRQFDDDFLDSLPESVDPCGENGEFHSFVYDGPDYEKAILYDKAEIYSNDGRFYFLEFKI
mgnify:CR=1 FL=1